MNLVTEAVGSSPTASYYIQRVKTKISSGVYVLEETACFCGSTQRKLVVEKDRYGFCYHLWLCRDCALLYASPRMTEEASKLFYENEYRLIYDGPNESAEQDFKNGLIHGGTLKELTDHLGIETNVVFDIGCNAGGWLIPFQAKGAKVCGVDWDTKRAAYGRSQGLKIVDDTSELTGQADLIILNHVLEHFLDMRTELTKIRSFLKPTGTLYVGVPGLYNTTKNRPPFQAAHNYEFTAATLKYVMECIGFRELYLDEYISSLWQSRETMRSIESRSTHEVSNILNFLYESKRKVPEIRTANKFPAEDRIKNIRAVLALRKPDIKSLVDTELGQKAIIIGGGPSVDEQLEKLRALIDDGAKVIAIERMYSWCLDHNIKPDYVVALDASEDVASSFGNVSHETIHLIGTQCKPDLFDRLERHQVYIFNSPQRGLDMMSMWNEFGYEATTTVNAGGSVTLCCMSIAMTLGMRDLHIFGFDCHITDGGYAKGITGVGVQNILIDIEVDGRVFKTTPPYLSFAQQFFKLIDMARSFGMVESIDVYGDSLVNAMWDKNGDARWLTRQ